MSATEESGIQANHPDSNTTEETHTNSENKSSEEEQQGNNNNNSNGDNEDMVATQGDNNDINDIETRSNNEQFESDMTTRTPEEQIDGNASPTMNGYHETTEGEDGVSTTEDEDIPMTQDDTIEGNGIGHITQLAKTFEILTEKLVEEHSALKDTHFKDYTRLGDLKQVLGETDNACKSYHEAAKKLTWQVGKVRESLVAIRNSIDKKLGDEGLYSWLTEPLSHPAGELS